MREALALTQDNAGLAVIAAGEKGFAAGGYRKMFESMLATQQELYAKGQLTAYDLAQSNCRLGRKAAALSYLQTSLERAEPDMVSLRADPALDSLRDEPVFRDIVRRFDLGAHR
jgi:predicted metal-binding protein